MDRLFSRLLKQNGVGEVHTVVVNNCAAAVMLALNRWLKGARSSCRAASWWRSAVRSAYLMS